MPDRRKTQRVAVLAMVCLFAAAAASSMGWWSATPAVAGKTKAAKQPVIGQGRDGLPNAVSEMRDAILAAARSGRLDELLIPIQWNELPPDFGDLSVKETLADWKKRSPDGSGREWLAK